MRMVSRATKPRRATNVSLPAELIDEARRLSINISQACEQGLEQRVKQSRADAWIEENRAAIDYWNVYVEQHGLPLAKYRQF
jgi:antitoxin CcdA